ncbi:precorrin-3B C(17)-methyltransferase [Candidatus Scalindua japonica]|uniref:Precorrin-3B C(17)-methyltransferase n=1 Tax=Candidatus Scalindua japonica TaxID=1284222 RepID=A0A286U0C5_9BACT|nr:cobalt-precorrin-4/precorrin-4 C(11)-methyltransferase [Candidatus Scalindua japonica]GAX61599.1 precorrin-3B C(17)-methyltransferase [Candidatus Scalindua japonica]
MKVYIIGAGPGDPKLITVRGAELIEQCPVVLYTGSLVSKAVIARADKNALVLDSASMDLNEIMDVFIKAKADNHDVARVHTGDPSIFGSTAEQMRRMRKENIDYEIIPGVSSFVASAAALGMELTLPELSQTVIISRCEGRTPVPDKEKLSMLAKHQSTLVLFLSAALDT